MKNTLIDIKVSLYRRIFDQIQKNLILNHLLRHDRMGKKPSHATVLLKGTPTRKLFSSILSIQKKSAVVWFRPVQSHPRNPKSCGKWCKLFTMCPYKIATKALRIEKQRLIFLSPNTIGSVRRDKGSIHEICALSLKDCCPLTYGYSTLDNTSRYWHWMYM